MKKVFALLIAFSIFVFMGAKGFQEVSHGNHVMDGKIMSGHEMVESDSSGSSSDECAKSCFMNAKREVFKAVLFSPPTVQKFMSLMVFAAFLLLVFIIFRNLRTFRLLPVPVKVFSGIDSTMLRE